MENVQGLYENYFMVNKLFKVGNISGIQRQEKLTLMSPGKNIRYSSEKNFGM